MVREATALSRLAHGRVSPSWQPSLISELSSRSQSGLRKVIAGRPVYVGCNSGGSSIDSKYSTKYISSSKIVMCFTVID